MTECTECHGAGVIRRVRQIEANTRDSMSYGRAEISDNYITTSVCPACHGLSRGLHKRVHVLECSEQWEADGIQAVDQNTREAHARENLARYAAELLIESGAFEIKASTISLNDRTFVRMKASMAVVLPSIGGNTFQLQLEQARAAGGTDGRTEISKAINNAMRAHGTADERLAMVYRMISPYIGF